MRHEHLVVTVEAGLKERIDADLESGESLESWVADAVERKLAAESEEGDDAEGVREHDEDRGVESGREPDGRRGGPPDRDRDDGRGVGTGHRGWNGTARDRASDGDDADESGDDYDEGFEYVDDCGI
ncbi:hypothetical protein [Halorussus sp. MSC15.2]|uniref:hypothetical protein n=1 Tax=Halorussus sp. MSC15.2 TaxID=2283638 RepID=UPI0013D4069A|nr:hypothetical protein [Halorussus sp. MSC15.2]NEU57888.1 hypothetical protein [Halorussus sp. MSC15.2]